MEQTLISIAQTIGEPHGLRCISAIMQTMTAHYESQEKNRFVTVTPNDPQLGSLYEKLLNQNDSPCNLIFRIEPFPSQVEYCAQIGRDSFAPDKLEWVEEGKLSCIQTTPLPTKIMTLQLTGFDLFDFIVLVPDQICPDLKEFLIKYLAHVHDQDARVLLFTNDIHIAKTLSKSPIVTIKLDIGEKSHCINILGRIIEYSDQPEMTENQEVVATCELVPNTDSEDQNETLSDQDSAQDTVDNTDLDHALPTLGDADGLDVIEGMYYMNVKPTAEHDRFFLVLSILSDTKVLVHHVRPYLDDPTDYRTMTFSVIRNGTHVCPASSLGRFTAKTNDGVTTLHDHFMVKLGLINVSNSDKRQRLEDRLAQLKVHIEKTNFDGEKQNVLNAIRLTERQLQQLGKK